MNKKIALSGLLSIISCMGIRTCIHNIGVSDDLHLMLSVVSLFILGITFYICMLTLINNVKEVIRRNKIDRSENVTITDGKIIKRVKDTLYVQGRDNIVNIFIRCNMNIGVKMINNDKLLKKYKAVIHSANKINADKFYDNNCYVEVVRK